MIVVVSDTSPLQYLVLVEQSDVLAELFDEVMVPRAVLGELGHERAPEPVRRWSASPPPWLVVRDPLHTDDSLKLGEGEKAAIALACEVRATLIVIDDRDAVRDARARGLVVAGTLAILDEAADLGLISDLPGALERLVGETNFRVGAATERIIQELLRRDRVRERARRP